jgi:hypothetical protein
VPEFNNIGKAIPNATPAAAPIPPFCFLAFFIFFNAVVLALRL